MATLVKISLLCVLGLRYFAPHVDFASSNQPLFWGEATAASLKRGGGVIFLEQMEPYERQNKRQELRALTVHVASSVRAFETDTPSRNRMRASPVHFGMLSLVRHTLRE